MSLSHTFLGLFLLAVPFFNILGKNVGQQVPFGLLGLLSTFILLVFLYRGDFTLRVNRFLLAYCMLLGFNLIAVYTYHILEHDFADVYFMIFYGEFILIMLLFSLVENLQAFVGKYYQKLLLYFILLISFSIIVDFFLLQMGFASYQLMYDSGLHSYLDRPFGIFGQPSVNSTLLVAFYLFYLWKDPCAARITSMLFLVVSCAIFFQGSGSGLLSYLILLILLFRRNKYYIFLILALLAGGIILLLSDAVYKFSWAYLEILFVFFKDVIIVPYTEGVMSTSDVLFGINGKTHIPIDLGPLFLIAKVGLIYFILYLGLIAYIFQTSSCRYYKAAFIVLLVGSLHYPVMFYIAAQFVLVLTAYASVGQKRIG